MTALAEALLAAQRQAIGALSKAYVNATGDEPNREALCESLDEIGCTDTVDQAHLLAALDLLRLYGVPAPKATQAEPKPDPETEPATERQMAFLASLADEKGTLAPDGPLTKAQASQAITELQNGPYDPDKWRAPF